MVKSNNKACVLKVCVKHQCVLSTGDIEKKFESTLIKRYPKILHSQVLIVPHHGSRTSSSYGFLRAVSPQLALVPAGFQGRFKLPAKSVVRRYHSLGIKMVNVAHFGAISFMVSARGVADIQYSRLQSQRIWRH